MASNERRYRHVKYTHDLPRASSTVNTMADILTACPPPPDQDISYSRRPTGSYVPRPQPYHRVPTTPISSLANSATTGDLSTPTPRQFRPQFPLMRRFTPTRIPSPVWDRNPTGRYVSTPVLPSQKTHKENVQHKPHQGPLPTSNKPASFLPKSRTMDMLSNLTSSFSRSNLSVDNSRQASISSTHPADVMAGDPDYIPLPPYTSHLQQINGPKAELYWCGRFKAISDRFNHEQIELMLSYDITYIPSPPSPSATSRTSDEDESNDLGIMTYDTLKTTWSPLDRYESQDKINSRAFRHLQSLCTTNEARRSLWEFQLGFARSARKPHLLPRGGKMVDDGGNWFGRVGRAMVGGSNTGFGARTSMGMGKRKTSMASFFNSERGG